MSSAANRGPDAAPDLPVPFSISVQSQRNVVTVAPRGELDIATVDQLQQELERLRDKPTARIVIDLRGVEFLDSTALHLLVSAQHHAQHGDWKLTIVPGPPAVQRIFEITRTIDRLPFTAARRASTG